jgi:hypothetical protein
MTVLFRENNSGGYWRLTDEQWAALAKAGWTVEARSSSGGNRVATVKARSVDAARVKWEKVVGRNPHDRGCECCGWPFNFYRD